MKKRKNRRSPAKTKAAVKGRKKGLLSLALLVSLAIGGTVLARWFSRPAPPPQSQARVDPASLNVASPAKEYIYAGGRLIATEEPSAQLTNNAQYISQSVPTSMSAGQTYAVSVTMKNTGTTTWTAPLYMLGTQNPQDNTTFGNTPSGLGRIDLPAPQSVAPGATVIFNFNVTAPSTAGTYNFQRRMVQHTVEWFGDFTPNVLVTVTGGSCSYSISPTSAAYGASGGSGSVSVTAGAGCSWTAVSNNPSFLTITTGSSGTGNGTVFYSLQANSGAARSGTLTIAGQTFTVTQAGTSSGPMTIGVWDPPSGNWYIRYSNSPGNPDLTIQYGGSIYLPVVGDWNGSGIMTIGMYEPATGNWYIKYTNTPGNPDLTINFGGSNYLPVVGDWDGNGTWTVGLYDPSSGYWYLKNSNTSGAPSSANIIVQYGGGNIFKPVVGNWNGGAAMTIGVYEPGTGNWKVRYTNTPGNPDLTVQYGGGSYVPVVGDWDGNGNMTIGVWDQPSGNWYIKNSNTPGNPDLTIQYGGNPYLPVVGRWH